MNEETFIHSSAEIAAGARIGGRTRIWQNSIILDGAIIGDECKLAHNIFVEGGVRVGDRVTIKDNITLYNGLTVGDDVFIGPNVVFTNVKIPRSFLPRGENNFLKTVIGVGASLGANATIICGNTIGRYAMVGAGSVVTGDVPCHTMVAGNPARQIGWVSVSGHRLGPDLICPENGEKYEETSSGLARSE